LIPTKGLSSGFGERNGTAFLADLALGVTASVVANVITSLQGDPPRILRSECRKALSLTAEKLVSTWPDHFSATSQVESFFSLETDSFASIISGLAAGMKPSEPDLVAVVRQRLQESGNIAGPPEDVIGLFHASDSEISEIFHDYLRILNEEIRRTPRLSYSSKLE